MEGVVKEVETLACTSCSDLIPNCLACKDKENCDMCKPGFSNAEIYDSNGYIVTICIPDFCGFLGEGDSCTGAVTIEGCAKSKPVAKYRDVKLKSCETCLPGYYSIQNPDYPDEDIQLCSP